MKQKRRKFTSAFKAQVAIEALRERETLAELSMRYEAYPNIIGKWKGMPWHGWIEGTPSQLDPENRSRLDRLAVEGIPVSEGVFGDGHYLRPPFVQPYKCNNVMIHGVTFLDSPFWFLNPVLCENLIFENVSIKGHGPNHDGCNPETNGSSTIHVGARISIKNIPGNAKFVRTEIAGEGGSRYLQTIYVTKK